MPLDISAVCSSARPTGNDRGLKMKVVLPELNDKSDKRKTMAGDR